MLIHHNQRTIKHNEQVDWGTPPPLYERAVFNWNEVCSRSVYFGLYSCSQQEPVEPQQLRAVRVVFDWDEVSNRGYIDTSCIHPEL